MRIEVTAEDIANGKRGATCLCPIALALKRAGFPGARVQPWNWNGDKCGRGPFGTIEFLSGGGAKIPFDAAEKARNFDDGHFVEPFAFDLDVTP